MIWILCLQFYLAHQLSVANTKMIHCQYHSEFSQVSARVMRRFRQLFCKPIRCSYSKQQVSFIHADSLHPTCSLRLNFMLFIVVSFSIRTRTCTYLKKDPLLNKLFTKSKKNNEKKSNLNLPINHQPDRFVSRA